MSIYAKYRKEWIEKYNSGMSFRAIGLEYKVSKATVQSVIKDFITKRPKSPTKKYAEKWKQLYEEGWSVSEIARKYNFSVTVISKRLKELGVEVLSNYIAESEYEIFVQEWIELYKKNHSLREIANKYGCSVQTVSNHLTKEIELRSYSETSRLYELNELYFSNINTKEKAYWLGYLFANGSTIESLQSNSIQLTASEKQKERVETFLKALSTERPILQHKGENVYSVRISNQQLFSDVRNYGLVNNKTHGLNFPKNINGNFIKSFILGYFDGKGFIESRRPQMAITGSPSFLTQLLMIIEKELHLKWNIKESQPNHYKVIAYSKKDIITFLDWLYEEEVEYDKQTYELYQAHKESPTYYR